MSGHAVRLAALCALTLCLAGCGAGNLTITNIQTGRSLNSDNSIGAIATTLKPSDKIHVAVLTDGSGSATLGVKFSHSGAVVSEQEKKVSYRGAAATEFHLDYAGPTPTGDYDIEILFNGQPAGMRKVHVE
jgi:hypothetical protein